MTPMRKHDPACADTALVSYYCRLHDKLLMPDGLFDPSWGCDSVCMGDRLAWAKKLFCLDTHAVDSRPFFHHVVERMILLRPVELQRLLCAISLSTRGDTLRRCIDGDVLRALEAVVGSKTLTAIRRAERYPAGVPVNADLRIPTLLAEGFSYLSLVYAGQRELVLNCIRLALPIDLPDTPPAANVQRAEQVLSRAREWYPEFKWLFG